MMTTVAVVAVVIVVPIHDCIFILCPQTYDNIFMFPDFLGLSSKF